MKKVTIIDKFSGALESVIVGDTQAYNKVKEMLSGWIGKGDRIQKAVRPDKVTHYYIATNTGDLDIFAIVSNI